MVHYDPLPGAHREIKAALGDIALTINAEEWFPIEQPIVNEIGIELPGNALKSYQELERELLTYIGGSEVEAAKYMSMTRRSRRWNP